MISCRLRLLFLCFTLAVLLMMSFCQISEASTSAHPKSQILIKYHNNENSSRVSLYVPKHRNLKLNDIIKPMILRKRSAAASLLRKLFGMHLAPNSNES